MLNVQKFLRENPLEKLNTDLGIKIKRHPVYPHLVMLKYDQIESDKHNSIVKECRGIILNKSQDWKIVNYSFLRFLNYGEFGAAEIDWQTAKIYDKEDGSLCQMWFYDGKWHVSTSGMPAAEGEVDLTGITFRHLFWRVFYKLNYKLPSKEWENHCFAFELTSPHNQVVVKHEAEDLILIGCRNLETLQEVDIDTVGWDWGWNTVIPHKFQNIDQVLEVCKNLNGAENEGFVVVDKDFNRVKVKSTQYVELSHIRDGMSSRRLLEIIRNGESSEFLNYFEIYRPQYNTIKEKYDQLVENLESIYNGISNIESQKEFALKALRSQCPGALFQLRKGTPIRTYLASMNIKNLLETLEMQ